MKKIQIGNRISENLKEWLDKKAIEEGRSLNNLVEWILKKYRENNNE